MGRALLRLARMSPGADIILLTRAVVGRNIVRHGTGQLRLDESTRWRIYVQPRSPQPVAVHCVSSSRALQLRWLTRFDPRLPAHEDGARYPFCPPAQWWRRGTLAVETRRSKPAWIDSAGNGWTRPNIPGGRGYHWDVFIREFDLCTQIGVDQLNIVEAMAPAAEGKPGSIHHVPDAKAGKVHDSGWTC